MDEDIEKLIRQFDFNIPLNIAAELLIKLNIIESRVSAMWEFYPQIAAAALHKDEEECEDKLDKFYNEEINKHLTDMIGRFGKLKNGDDSPVSDSPENDYVK